MEGTWKFLGPSNHMDQLLVCHAGEQCHHGDLGVGSAHLLSGAEHWGLSTLKQEENLKNQQYNKVEPERRINIVAIHCYSFLKWGVLTQVLRTCSGLMLTTDVAFPPLLAPPPRCFLLSCGGAVLRSRTRGTLSLSLDAVCCLSRLITRPRSLP